MAAMSSRGSYRFSTRPISSKDRRRASTSLSSAACTSLANATRMRSSRRLVSPKSSSTGTEASPSTAVDTRMFPACGSALKSPPTCICAAQASHIRRSSSPRSVPAFSIAATSRTEKPAQYSIVSTRSVTRPAADRGTTAAFPRFRRRRRTSNMFAASVRKSSSRSTSREYSSHTGPKSRSGSERARSDRMMRREDMSCRIRDATPRCCTLTTTSRPSNASSPPSASGRRRTARWTCARLAVESGAGSIREKMSSSRPSNSSRSVRRTSPKGTAGTSSCSDDSASTYAPGITSARVERYWPTLIQNPRREPMPSRRRAALRTWASSRRGESRGWSGESSESERGGRPSRRRRPRSRRSTFL
mmetsp:Transcript_14289/g.31292  ORF Transcript_14289/g.31292 Transcript_14289/m.31292 type:complete len:361 (-) Transcript_14289:379-1461(-)